VKLLFAKPIYSFITAFRSGNYLMSERWGRLWAPGSQQNQMETQSIAESGPSESGSSDVPGDPGSFSNWT
jgi:hypothetical protein